MEWMRPWLLSPATGPFRSTQRWLRILRSQAGSSQGGSSHPATAEVARPIWDAPGSTLAAPKHAAMAAGRALVPAACPAPSRPAGLPRQGSRAWLGARPSEMRVAGGGAAEPGCAARSHWLCFPPPRCPAAHLPASLRSPIGRPTRAGGSGGENLVWGWEAEEEWKVSGSPGKGVRESQSGAAVEKRRRASQSDPEARSGPADARAAAANGRTAVCPLFSRRSGAVKSE